MSINRVPILVWGTVTASVANFFAIARREPRVLPAVDGPQLPARISSTCRRRPTAFLAASVLDVRPSLGLCDRAARHGHGFRRAARVLPKAAGRLHAVALSTVATMVLGFGVWVHHMFATGLPIVSLSFFSAASIIIVMPSAVGVFAWIATIWTGTPVFTTAFLFFASFIVLFTIGGVSGFMTGRVPVDWQLTDTYFVVAHLHYVLIGINVFPVMGAHLFLVPQNDGEDDGRAPGPLEFLDHVHRLQSRLLSDAHLGPARHAAARLHLCRRHGLGHAQSHHDAGFLRLCGRRTAVHHQRGVSYRRGRAAGDNPWDAPTLEWATSSPPPPYNFAVIPTVASRHPLWERSAGRIDAEAQLSACRDLCSTTAGKRSARRRSTPARHHPQDAERFLAPFILALTLTAIFTGLVLHCGGSRSPARLASGRDIIGWLWPERTLGETAEPANG
jgi:hypothetical protein